MEPNKPEGDNPPPPTVPPAEPPKTDPPATDPNKPGDPPKLFTQADLDRIVKDRLDDEKKRAQKRIDDEKRAVDEARMKEQGEYKTLFEQKEAELAELRPMGDLAKNLAKRMNATIDAEIGEWPEKVRVLDPGAKNLEARLDWLEKARPLVEDLRRAPVPPVVKAGPGPGEATNGKVEITDAQRQEQAKQYANVF